MDRFQATLKNGIVMITFATKKVEAANTDLELFSSIDSDYMPNINANDGVISQLIAATTSDYGYGIADIKKYTRK